MDQIIKFFSSLRLTVFCLVLAMVLVVFGTLAQVDLGIWEAQDRYFKTWLVWWEISEGVSLPVFPGGHLIGLFLLVNLVVAHLTRFKWSKKKLGIFLTHLGLIVLLVGGLLTDLFSVESAMEIEEGESKNYSESFLERELAITETGNPSFGEFDEVTTIPLSFLKEGEQIKSLPENIPFDIEIIRLLPNSFIGQRQSGDGGEAKEVTKGFGTRVTVMPKPITYNENEINIISAVVKVVDRKTSQSLGVWLLTNVIKASQTIELEGRTFSLSLRSKRYYYPFRVYLKKFSNDYYPGTDNPRNFSSLVRLKHPAKNEDRDVLIYMNHPLRYEGKTFYQQRFRILEDKKATILQVVKNPSWQMPYIGCSLMGIGLLIQFGMHLVVFVRKRSEKVQRVGKSEKMTGEIA